MCASEERLAEMTTSRYIFKNKCLLYVISTTISFTSFVKDLIAYIRIVLAPRFGRAFRSVNQRI